MKRECLCNWNISSTSRKSAISELLRVFSFRETIENLLLTALDTREQAGATVVHKGIAMPHCRSILVDEFMIAVGRSEKGIPWPEETVKMVILFLTPALPSGSHEHMMLIRQLAKSLRGDGADKFLASETPEEAVSHLGFKLLKAT